MMKLAKNISSAVSFCQPIKSKCANSNALKLFSEDKPGYCKRALCECDAQFARDLYAQRMNYNRDNHHRYGSIEVEEQVFDPLNESLL